MNAAPEIVAAVRAKYPSKATEAARSCVAIGGPIQGRHQKYRLSDGTVVCMPWTEPAVASSSVSAVVPHVAEMDIGALISDTLTARKIVDAADVLEAHVAKSKKKGE
jgi:hypothetical protein